MCLIVNVASKCGLTATNYKELNELYDEYAESKGTVEDDTFLRTSLESYPSITKMIPLCPQA